MSTPNRATLLAKTHKVLKKHYKPAAPPAERTLLEHLLYASCLENASFEAADEAFARLQQSYFDWNEIRVTTVAELSESMSMLPDAAAAALRLKRGLQGVFETHYAFDLEFLKKQNIGKALKELEKLGKLTEFSLAYVNQHGLGGHSIPTNVSALHTLVVLGIITESEAAANKVPGMERAIAKSKGVEFGSLLHQLAVDYAATPGGTKVRAILLEISPSAKERMTKRSVKHDEPEEKQEPEKRDREKRERDKPESAPPNPKATSKKADSGSKEKPPADAGKKKPNEKSSSAVAKKLPVDKPTEKPLAKKKPR